MPRWPGDADKRLKTAALEVALDVGWPAVTVDLVVERAGVSQRTFFRHFSDKEEVLFAEDESLRAVLVDAARQAPPGPLVEVVHTALLALAEQFEPRRHELRARALVIAQDRALQGRDLVKQAGWAAAAAAALVARGVPPRLARLATDAGGAVLRTALQEWLAPTSSPGPSSTPVPGTAEPLGEESGESLATLLSRLLDELREIVDGVAGDVLVGPVSEASAGADPAAERSTGVAPVPP